MASSLSAAGADSAQAQNYQGECSEGLEELHPANSVLYCSDQDFQTLATLSEKLLRHAALMLLLLTEPQVMQDKPRSVTKASYSVLESTEKLLEALPNEFTYSEMLSICEELDIPKTTMKRRKDALLANKIIGKKPNGHYIKL